MKTIDIIDTEPLSQRIDLWLWHARIYKTRSISATITKSTAIRLNSILIHKPSTQVKRNDILTFPYHNKVRVIKILNFSKQRVAARNISLLYEEILEK
ncbi:RNA-binding S4 domain-containing protein [Commensalibacter oyaizuii]|uniref:RNA-binding S4 domain-containing protein n=1 Tax=Commensalibacter oyaizuii TaxID=3043873 RepID=A0ABT6PYY8_9PROT|nr:hypothetical protein [Commensalibacter sp. TBRC 16381]MDI2090039.1 hypothetical protein [Commensalibacter sp. TBRC 16381]